MTTSPKPRKTTARKTTEAEDKAAALVLATDVLSSRVGALADAVQTNNFKIDSLQGEVNKKPDDVEVKFITGLAEAERKRHLKYAIGTSILCAFMASGVAYIVADEEGEMRCSINAQNINTIVRLLESLPDPEKRYTSAILDLRSNRNDC